MKALLAAWLLFCSVATAGAAGPRWVAGVKWTNNGRAMNWYRADVQYFVDAGPLSSTVDHATAVALVDAAAGVWNIANSGFTLTGGGALSEDVSSANVYLGSAGPVWPADVQSSSYAGKQIAVVFDSDGSITDMLLGSGASDVANCRTNGVTESVDLFIQPGKIAHALLIVNGRCTGAAAEKQLQLRYQMMRAFGRIIGLGWSQTNDNVFTGTPAPTYLQQMHWPIMHPIDILCGVYTYQCQPQPFVLRDDDVSSVRFLYDPNLTNLPKDTVWVNGYVRFPNGQAMNGVNLTAVRSNTPNGYGAEPYQVVSAVSGYLALGDLGNPVAPVADTANVSGSASITNGGFELYAIPGLTQYGSTMVTVTGESVNPLYTGQYAVGPYRAGTPAPSGNLALGTYYGTNGYRIGTVYLPVAGAATECGTGNDGTEAAPAAVPIDGVWSGRLCGVGHLAWGGLAVRAGRTATLEVTALDESGIAASSKAMPVLGMWHGGDATGTLPTLTRQAVAFNAKGASTTQLRASFTAAERVRFVIGDQRGDGRPDYSYRARLLYADSVQPSRLSAAGGAVRILGTGFAAGNTVTVGGVSAAIVSVSATEIDVVAPTLAALGGAATVDVVVNDLRTGGSTTMSNAMLYSGAADDKVSVVSAPSGTVVVGSPQLFVVKVVDASGKAAANATVSLSVSTGSAVFRACVLSTCTLVTDANGQAQTAVTAQAAGTVVLQAALKSGSTAQASFVATTVARSVQMLRPSTYVASGAGVVFSPAAIVLEGGAASGQQVVSWTTASTRLTLRSSSSATDSSGVALNAATGSLRENETATISACAWTSVCAVESVTAVADADLRLALVSGDGQSVPVTSTLQTISARVTDAAGHPVAGATVTIHQVVTAWQPPCAATGRCAAAAVYGRSAGSVTSDDDGLVSVDPLQYASTAAVTKITLAAGTQAAATFTLQKTP